MKRYKVLTFGPLDIGHMEIRLNEMAEEGYYLAKVAVVGETLYVFVEVYKSAFIDLQSDEEQYDERSCQSELYCFPAPSFVVRMS